MGTWCSDNLVGNIYDQTLSLPSPGSAARRAVWYMYIVDSFMEEDLKYYRRYLLDVTYEEPEEEETLPETPSVTLSEDLSYYRRYLLD